MRARIRSLARAIDEGDDAQIERAVLTLSRSRKAFAPLALTVGAVLLMAQGVRLLLSNWRLTLIQVLPGMWIWLAMYDLKAHLLRGNSLRSLDGWVVLPLVAGIALVTAAGMFLNAVFAFAIARPGGADIRAGFRQARAHSWAILGWGLAIGAALGVSTMVLPRWGRWWFVISLSTVVGVLMVAYIAVPARLLGVRRQASRRDKASATLLGAAIGAVVCTPPYLLGRIGIILLGVRALFVPGLILLTLGVTLQAGATGAVSAIKVSAKLMAGRTAPP